MLHIPKTYYVKTFGCQMNVSDSERIATFLEAQGFLECGEIKDANLVIFNTCGVKQTAENRAYSLINNLRKTEKASHLKTKTYLPTGQAGKPKTIILTGCLANRADVQKRMQNKVDLFCEIKNFPEAVASILYNVSGINSKIHNTSYNIPHTKNPYDKEDLDYLSIQPKHQNSFEAYVPIMTGCNNFCAYCVVPNARGREVSRPAEEIITEVKDLVARGYKNILLLGQNVNSYQSPISIASSPSQGEDVRYSGQMRLSTGTDESAGCDFPTLLKKINSIPGKFWIQFVSSHPKDMSDELIEAMTKCKKVCEAIHLPVQAGDDEILRRMNRRYTQKHYLTLIKKINLAFKKNKPEKLFSISSDIIVGFPGETRQQFLQSASLMEKSKFDMVFFGQFSPRPETAAWKMKDNVSQKEKARREKYLNEILKKTALENNQKYLSKIVEVLIEKKAPKAKPSDEGLAFGNLAYFGKTRTLKNVKVTTSKKDLLGKIVKVKIIKANVWNLEGEF